jgi:NADPH:quinone reductase-like Zn-dependent oxidoreductase
MKAIVCTRYGPPEVLVMREMEKPVPADHEILVKVHATTVTAGDMRVRQFKIPLVVWLPVRAVFGFTKPRKAVLGIELAGEVEATGALVRRFQPGDAVFAASLTGYGGYAQYKCLAEDGPVAIKPSNLTYEEAAAVPIGARTALHYLRGAGICKGQNVVIYGASGSVGTYAVQLARHFGAHVTAVCSTENMALVRSLGADEVVDYTREDFSRRGPVYDIVFDTVDKCPFAVCDRSLKPGGIYLNCTAPLPGPRMLVAKLARGRRLMLGQSPPETAGALEFLAELIEAGEIRVVVDRRYTLDQIVEAHRYADRGHKKGNVVVSVPPGPEESGAGRLAKVINAGRLNMPGQTRVG